MFNHSDQREYRSIYETITCLPHRRTVGHCVIFYLGGTAVDQREAQDLQKIGSVSVSSVNGSLDDVTRQLSQQAKAEGASHFRVIGVNTPGDSSLWTGTAEIYR
ncbi:hypothetical protein BN1184_BF_00280 [Pantoea ananatis]|nr:hypothetical protein BN1184_BF_00280 [Pantoea ananatis]